MPNDEVKLAACPFCGGEAKVGESQEIIFAGCVDPDCIGYRLAFDFVSEETAAAAWNRRAIPSTVSGETVPVAWQHRGPRGGWITTDERTKWSERALYLAAKPAETQAVEVGE